MKYSTLVFAVVILFTFFSIPALGLAAESSSGFGTPTGSSGFGAPTGSSGNSPTFALKDPLGVKNFCELVKTLLNIVMAIGIPVAVLFLVWAGFKFILARGRPTELGVARKNFMYVIIGIAVFLGAWTLAMVISTTIQSLGANGSAPFCG